MYFNFLLDWLYVHFNMDYSIGIIFRFIWTPIFISLVSSVHGCFRVGTALYIFSWYIFSCLETRRKERKRIAVIPSAQERVINCFSKETRSSFFFSLSGNWIVKLTAFLAYKKFAASPFVCSTFSPPVNPMFTEMN